MGHRSGRGFPGLQGLTLRLVKTVQLACAQVPPPQLEGAGQRLGLKGEEGGVPGPG